MPLHGTIVAIKQNGKDGSRFPICPVDLVIYFGQSDYCDIKIDIPGVSEFHCSVGLKGSSQIYLTHLSKVNPTLLNDRAVSVFRKTKKLHHRDKITIMDQSFRFEHPYENMPCHGTLVAIKENQEDGARFHLRDSSCVIGPSRDCDIKLNFCLGRMAYGRIDVNQNGQIFLTNLIPTRNPTKLNHRGVTQPTRVHHRDTITVMNHSFRFEFPPRSASAHPREVVKVALERMQTEVRNDVHRDIQKIYDAGSDILLSILPYGAFPSQRYFTYHLRAAKREALPPNTDSRAKLKLKGSVLEPMVLLDKGSKDRIIILGSHKKNIEDLCGADTIHITTSTRSAPQLFDELLVIHAVIDGRLHTLIFCLLPKRGSSVVYTKVFNMLKGEAVARGYRLKPRVIVAVDAAAIRKSLSKCFSGISIKGCYHSYCRDIYWKARELELLPKSVDSCKPIVKAVKQVAYLPMLPKERMKDTFMQIQDSGDLESLPLSEMQKLYKFFEYIQTEWLEDTATHKWWNQWEMDDRINSAVRSFYIKQSAHLERRPTIFRLFQFVKTADYEPLPYYRMMRHYPSHVPKLSQQAVETAKDKLKEGHFTSMQYLDRLLAIHKKTRKMCDPHMKYKPELDIGQCSCGKCDECPKSDKLPDDLDDSYEDSEEDKDGKAWSTLKPNDVIWDGFNWTYNPYEDYYTSSDSSLSDESSAEESSADDSD